MATQRTVSDQLGSLADLTPAQQKELLEKLLRERAKAAKLFPMSEGQQGLWHAYRRDPKSTTFNVFLPTRVRSPLDLTQLKAAVEHLVRRHASLRTTFTDRDGPLLQQVHDDLPPEFAVEQVAGMAEDELRERVSAETLRPFDLERGPLLRVLVYQRAADDFVVLALTHHIVTDFWSLVLVLNELRQTVPALARGAAPNLPTVANNYREFVQEQQALLASPRGEQLARYWQQEVRQAGPVVNFTTDFVRPRQFSGRAENVPLSFDHSLAEQLTHFARENRCTPVAVVQAALQVFIQRYTGQDSFFVGSPFSGRQHRKFETTTGFFVNMLPLRANLEADPTFAELSRMAAQTLLGALEHEAYPISRIVSESNVPRDPSRSPLFQVSCTFEKAQLQDETGRGGFLFPGATQTWNFGGLKQESFYVPCRTCHYDLEFIFEHTPHALQGMLCYCCDLFTRETALLMSRNFSSLLGALLSNGHRQISRVAWSNAARTANLQTEPPERSALVREADTIDGLLSTAATEHADRTAIYFDGQTWTYRDILDRASRLEQALRQHPTRPGQTIPLLAPRGPASWIGMLGILRAGTAFIPLDQGQAAMPLGQACAESQSTLAVSVGNQSVYEGDSFDCVQLDPQGGILSLPRSIFPTLSESAPIHPARHDANSLAYVVYTSGSTGKPKGVMLSHRAVCNTLRWRMRDIPLEATDRVLMLLSHQFDAGLGIAWTTLSQGATLVMASEQDIQDPARLIELMIRERVNVLPAPPSLLGVILNHPRFAACAPQVRQVWTGGEAMPHDLPSQVKQLTGARFVNFYGPTEAAIEATFYDATAHPQTKPVPIGKAIAGAEIVILDSQRRPVPDTVPGEIAIGGVGLAEGYLNDQALTSLKFVPHPGDDSGQARVYLTGDRGRRNAQGNIEFLGRTDHQVKLRGYRLELGEIETVLEAHPRVTRAALKVTDAGTAHAQLLAFASVSVPIDEPGKRQALTASLRRYLREHLPAYKVPAALCLVDSLPLTSSGKVDRSRLPNRVPAEALDSEFLEPATPLEEFLARAWCELLEIERVSTHQNFFDAGGSSLQAAMLTTSLSNELGVAIPTALLFDLADISQMAQRLVELHPQVIAERFGADCVTRQQQLAAENLGNQPRYHELLVPLKESGSRMPLFLIHPPGGIVVCYRDLAQQIHPDQPVYGVRSRGLHGTESLPATLADMAADYLNAIRTVQPTGGYRLGGWSLGGLIAYEMARQLTDAGETVDQLFLLDTTIPTGASPLVPEHEQVNVGLEYGIELTLDQLGELAPEEQLPYLWEHAKKLGVLADDSPPEVVAKALEDLQELFHHHVALSASYRIDPLDLDIVLFRPKEVPFELDVSPDRGWQHLARSVQVHFVPGHHHSMVQAPHVQEMADILGDLLLVQT